MAHPERRSPSISEYIANLNSIPTTQDIHSSNGESFSLDDDLAMFTNTQFFDFDLGQDADLQPAGAGFETSTDAPLALPGEFKIADFSAYSASFGSAPADGLTISTSTYAASTSTSGSPTTTSHKRKAISSLSPSSFAESIENSSRLAAEEDKRRRNTAASARFRVKKKQREQALEKSAKEMGDKVRKLENRIQMLETENKWLKDLITEKNATVSAIGKDGSESGNCLDVEWLWRKFNNEKEQKEGENEVKV